MSEQRTNSFSIIDILQYVRKNTQTGRLLFNEKGAVIAELYFNKGHLIHARNEKNTGDDVVYQLLGNKTAQIQWERNTAPPQETVSRTDEMLLLGALGILTEDDANHVLDNTGKAAAQAAEKAIDTAFEPEPELPQVEAPAAPALAPPASNAAPLDEHPPEPVLPGVAAPVLYPPPAPGQSLPADQHFLPGGAIQAGTTGQLQAMLGDEVLRPPRFRHWSGLPLPFVSAYSLETPDRLVKSVYDLLWREKFSGVLSCVIGPVEGMTLLYRGRAVHSRFADGRSFYKDHNALRRVIELYIPAGERNNVLIYPLEAEFVHSYAALIMGEPELTGLSSQSVKINKLLNTLEQAQRTGIVHVSLHGENGYIFLSNGHKLGSYYEVEDVLEESILRVYQIVGKTGSMINVITSPPEDRLFEAASRPKGPVEIKRQLLDLAQEVFGKRASRIIQLISQATEDGPSLKTYTNQARRVAQIFIDKNLADQFYERAMFLLHEINED